MKALISILAMTVVLVSSVQAHADSLPTQNFKLVYNCYAGNNSGAPRSIATLYGNAPFVLSSDGSISARPSLLFSNGYVVSLTVRRTASSTSVSHLVSAPSSARTAASNYTIYDSVAVGKMLSVTSSSVQGSVIDLGACSMLIAAAPGPIATPTPVATATEVQP